MFGILIYILLPVVYLIHDVEEIVTRRRWEFVNYDKAIALFPRLEGVLSHLRDLNQFRFVMIVVEQLVLLVGAVILGIYVDPILMVAIFWGFVIHLFVHIAEAIAFKAYVPGVATAILLIPYSVIGIYDLSGQYSLLENIGLAILGFVLVALNLLFVHLLVSKY